MEVEIKFSDYEVQNYQLEIDYTDSSFEDYWFFILRDAESKELARAKAYSRSEAMELGFKALIDHLENKRKERL